MATLPAPRTWASGDVVTAAMLNDNIRDGFGFFLNPPRCIVYNSIALSVAAGNFLLMTWDSEVIDSDGMHSTSLNPSRITAQTAGVYDIQLHVRWQPASDSANRYCWVNLNNSGSVANPGDNNVLNARLGMCVEQLLASTTPPQVTHLRFQYHLGVGDYIEAAAGNTSSSAALTQGGSETRFSAVWLGSN